MKYLISSKIITSPTPLFFVTYLDKRTIKKMNYFGHKKYIFPRKGHLLMGATIILSVFALQSHTGVKKGGINASAWQNGVE